MSQDAATWPALANLQLCWARQFLTATHVCSYSCFLSQFAPGGANHSACWLSQQPAGAEGSQCPQWPSDYPQSDGMELKLQAGKFAAFPDVDTVGT